MTDLNFSEASKKANKGDKLLLEIEATDKKPGFMTEIIKGDGEDKGEFFLSWYHYHLRGWQIIPAKKKMVSAEKLAVDMVGDREFASYSLLGNYNKQSAINMLAKAARLSAENRDILYADLMKQVGKLLIHFPSEYYDIKQQLDKINAVLNPTSAPT